MPFSVDTFMSEPSLNELAALKRSELQTVVVLATHCNLQVSSGMRKVDVRLVLMKT